MISRVCEEFQCLPSDAVRELGRCESLIFDILELRAYANTKRATDEADASNAKPEHYPKGPMADMVIQIQYDLHRELFADGE